MDQITIKSLSEDEFRPLYRKYRAEVFEDDHSYVLRDLLDDQELLAMKRLGQNLGAIYELNLAAYDSEGNFVGWCWGFQENSTEFYMCNSAVLPGYRRQGIYSKLLDKCLSMLKDDGFQMVYSRHCATNNPILIPKLKAGFIISKMEIDDRFGVLIHLHYYFNKTRKKIMDYRSGQLSPDEEIKKIFKI